MFISVVRVWFVGTTAKQLTGKISKETSVSGSSPPQRQGQRCFEVYLFLMSSYCLLVATLSMSALYRHDTTLCVPLNTNQPIFDTTDWTSSSDLACKTLCCSNLPLHTLGEPAISCSKLTLNKNWCGSTVNRLLIYYKKTSQYNVRRNWMHTECKILPHINMMTDKLQKTPHMSQCTALHMRNYKMCRM